MKALPAFCSALILAAMPAAMPAGGVASAQEADDMASDTAPYDGMAEWSTYLSSYDGTRLAVSVFRPTSSGEVEDAPLPVIVTQDRSLAPERFDPIRRYFVTHGYIVVAHDRRGTGASFGTQTGFVNEADRRDAKAVIDWAAGQPFSTGKAGAMGCSNQGIWQYGVAALQPQALKAIAPACASPMFFDHAVARNGVPMFPTKQKYYTGECPEEERGGAAPGLPPSEPRPVSTDESGALLAEALATRGCTAPMLGQYWLNMPRDGVNADTGVRPGIADTPMSHWREIDESGVAILQLGGWFDAAVAGQIEGQRVWGGRVIMGPWVHGNSQPEGADFANAERDLSAATLRWFDHYLKGIDNGAQREGVDYYTINAPAGTEWRSVAEWPVVEENSPLYLSGDRLAADPASADATPALYSGQDVRWFDGRYAPLARWWEGDMAPSDAASLVHTGEPLQAPVEMTGTPVARLWISSDQPDANIFAVIEDVAPDGRSTYVTDGVLRASWRSTRTPDWGAGDMRWHGGGEDEIVLLKPDTPTEVAFDFFPISYVFEEGHRIRLSIATGIGNDFQAPPAAEASPQLTVWRDERHPSWIELPIVREADDK